MKVPTVATTVFSPIYVASSPTDYDITFTGTQYVDAIVSFKDAAVGGQYNAPMWNDRLRGFPINMLGTTYANNPGVASSSAEAEGTGVSPVTSNYLSGVTMNRAVWGGGWTSYRGSFYGFKRASGFFDEVCYTGTGTAQALSHNLGVAPELLIIKSRNTAGTNWQVYSRFTSTTYGYQTLQTNSAGSSDLTYGPGGSPNFESFTAAPTASLINLASSAEISANGRTYVAYLFATCAGVSKVGSYTGTAAAQTINCGFTTGARFVLIKRTDSTGDWYVWDTAKGIVSGNDPYLLLNSAAVEVTNTDYIDPANSGFEISSTAPAAINASGGSFIFLAIA
jgi:hypothetical protein